MNILLECIARAQEELFGRQKLDLPYMRLHFSKVPLGAVAPK